MAVYESEQEQLEAIKKWWKENGTAVVAGFLIGLGLLVGWRWWQTYTDQQAQLASGAYEQVLYTLEQGEIDKAHQMAGLLLSEHSSSPYAMLAALNLARQDLEDSDIAASHARLQWIIEQNSRLPQLTHIARLRKAKLFLSEHKITEAKQLLNAVEEEPTFTTAYAELRGDIAVAEGQTEAARVAYAKVLENEDLSPKHREWIQMKLDDLGSATVDRIETQTPSFAHGNPVTAQENALTIPTDESTVTPSTSQEQVLTIPADATEASVTPSTNQAQILTIPMESNSLESTSVSDTTQQPTTSETTPSGEIPPNIENSPTDLSTQE